MKFVRKILSLHKKISMENWGSTHFLSDLPWPLSFYTALENNTIFLQQFFRFREGESSPLPLWAPLSTNNSTTTNNILIIQVLDVHSSYRRYWTFWTLFEKDCFLTIPATLVRICHDSREIGFFILDYRH